MLRIVSLLLGSRMYDIFKWCNHYRGVELFPPDFI